ncbi:hypothetical protein BB560_004471 [Smittium megazygosporum]|uniref:PHD-type domain-containing protein n=1 Tax=Smittium megazygosporum TaxID=133381 RepID=A0A2T9Z993_9FUNG|nr:hypothetical protein BB560_004471 [Smittium megazygosporum]
MNSLINKYSKNTKNLDISNKNFLWKATKLILNGQDSFQESDCGPLVIENSGKFDDVKNLEQQISNLIYPQNWGKVHDIKIFTSDDPQTIISLPDIEPSTKKDQKTVVEENLLHTQNFDNKNNHETNNIVDLKNENTAVKRSNRIKKQTERFSPSFKGSFQGHDINNSSVIKNSSGPKSPLKESMRNKKASITLNSSFSSVDNLKHRPSTVLNQNRLMPDSTGTSVSKESDLFDSYCFLYTEHKTGFIYETRPNSKSGLVNDSFLKIDLMPDVPLSSILVNNVKKSLLVDSRPNQKPHTNSNNVSIPSSPNYDLVHPCSPSFISKHNKRSEIQKNTYGHSSRGSVINIDNSRRLHPDIAKLSSSNSLNMDSINTSSDNVFIDRLGINNKRLKADFEIKSEPDYIIKATEGLYKGRSNDYCDSCNQTGKFICCDACPRVFHFLCADPPIDEKKAKELDHWFCAKCLYSRTRRHPDPEISNSIMGPLFEKLEGCNPKAFSVPHQIKTEFSGIKLGNNGEYELSNRGKVIKGYANLDRDYSILVDNAGKLIFCFRCDKTALHGSMIKCDYCSLSWHLDCLFPYNTIPPVAGQKWMCPNHQSNKLPSRKFRNEIIVDQSFYPFSSPNNGNIEILEDQTFFNQLPPVDDPQLKFKVPQKSIEESFLKISSQRHVYIKSLSLALFFLNMDASNIKKSKMSKFEWLQSVISFQQQVARYLLKNGYLESSEYDSLDSESLLDPESQPTLGLGISQDEDLDQSSDTEISAEETNLGIATKSSDLQKKREELEDPLVMFAVSAIKLLLPEENASESKEFDDSSISNFNSLLSVLSKNLNIVSGNLGKNTLINEQLINGPNNEEENCKVATSHINKNELETGSSRNNEFPSSEEDVKSSNEI